jgi:hypothetical protein
MWLNKGIPTLPSLFYSNPNPDRNGICNPNPDRNGIWVGRSGSGVLEGPSGFRHPGSGVNVPIIGYFTVLLFYFFEKKKCWNIGTFRLTLLILLKLLHKIEVKCSRKVKYARTVGIKHFFTYDF